MTARFILSLDCEGKWGVADQLNARHHHALCNANLRLAYATLLATLREFEIDATFAFVGCFTLADSELRRLPLRELAASCAYLRPALDDMLGGGEGWVGDWAVEAAGPRHEIASHGVTHVPWTDMTEDQARREMSLLPPRSGMTFVYPRNRIAHPNLLREFGISGYRASRRFGSRLASLASEFNVRARPDSDLPAGDPIAIPAGYFVNWRSGARRLVPTEISRIRARRMIQHAVRTDAVVHYWMHPENLASAPGTIHVLRAILREVSRAREQGKLVVMTQRQYCLAHPGQAMGHQERRR